MIGWGWPFGCGLVWVGLGWWKAVGCDQPADRCRRGLVRDGLSHWASFSTSQVVQHRAPRSFMWSLWVDDLLGRLCCDGELTSSAPIRLSRLLGHVAPGKGGNKTSNTELNPWPDVPHRCDRLPPFFFCRLYRNAHGVVVRLLRCLRELDCRDVAMRENNGTRDRLSHMLSSVGLRCHRH